MRLWLLLLAAALQAKESDASALQQDISIRGKAAAGAGVQVSAPRADRAVADEVINSLDLTRKSQRAPVPHATVSGSSQRLERPFPEPPFLTLSPRTASDAYDRWTFEVFDESERVYSQSGNGRLREALVWDGAGEAGGTAVRVERSYSFRFTGWDGDRAFVISSDPIRLSSLSYREFLGETHLEVSNEAVFSEGEASFAAGSSRFLNALGERLRRANLQGQPYRLTLYHDKPRGKLASARGRLVKKFFAKYLVITPERVEVDVLSAGARGEALACVLPPERGDSIKSD